jgi:hypothetical protein
VRLATATSVGSVGLNSNTRAVQQRQPPIGHHLDAELKIPAGQIARGQVAVFTRSNGIVEGDRGCPSQIDTVSGVGLDADRVVAVAGHLQCEVQVIRPPMGRGDAAHVQDIADVVAGQPDVLVQGHRHADASLIWPHETPCTVNARVYGANLLGPEVAPPQQGLVQAFDPET